jgi:hypothetical protein
MHKLIGLLLFISLSGSALAAVFGTDDRKDVIQVPRFQSIKNSIAVAVPGNFISKRADGFLEMTSNELLGLGSSVYACMDERFAKQPILGNCTGFLIGPKHVLTAGHCVINRDTVTNDSDHPYCKAFSWYFGFSVGANGKTSERKIDPNLMYKCKRIVRAENIELDPTRPGTKYGNDFAILELERPVASFLKPLPLKFGKIMDGSIVSTLGHPSGLPLKFSGLSQVLKNSNPVYFEANLDTLSGNSGGPVFDQNNQVVGILTSGHPVDYIQDPKGCYRVNRCSQNGKTCLEESNHQGLNRSNLIQRLDPLSRYLPRQ